MDVILVCYLLVWLASSVFMYDSWDQVVVVTELVLVVSF